MAASIEEAASNQQLSLQVTAAVPVDAASFVRHYRTLREWETRVVLLCMTPADTFRFMSEALEEGIGGEGFLWIYSYGASNAPEWGGANVNPQLRDSVFQGSLGSSNHMDMETTAFQAYQARQLVMGQAMRSNTSCNLETDDDRNAPSYLWAQDHSDENASSPYMCTAFDMQLQSSWEAYTYDAVFAVAHALHDLIEVQNRTEILSSELLDTLIMRVRFEGVTGLIDFFDSEANSNWLYRGDRRTDVSYGLLNYVNGEMVRVGVWTACEAAESSWSDRWVATPRVGLTYSTVDNSRPPQTAPPRVTVVRLGVLLPSFGTAASGFVSEASWSPRLGVYQAMHEINNKSDGVADNLLPGTRLMFAYRDSKCDATESLSAALQLTNAFGGAGVSALVGAGCSGASEMAAQ
eukprot:1014842-Prymnesium_polylepis.1